MTVKKKLITWVVMVFNATFNNISYIVVVSFIGVKQQYI